MKNLRLAILLGGGILGATGVLLACSSDDTVITDDAGTDAATPDTGIDSGADAADTGADVLIDAGLTFDSFIDQMGEAYCSSLTRCCFGDPNLAEGEPVDGGGAFDSGTYDKTTCINLARRVGWEGSLTNATAANDAGKQVVLDQARALDCVAKVKAVSCLLARTDFVAIRTACFNAIRGTGTAGSNCSTSIECAPGFFCSSTQKCEALRGENEPCGDFTTDNGIAEEACSWRGSGDTNRFCETYDDAGTAIEDAGAWVCRTALPNGSFCNNSAWCAEGMCSIEQFEYICKEPVTYFPREPDNCGQLVK